MASTSERFEPFVAREVFSELHGFVLLDPDRLDHHHDGAALHRDLLTLYATTEEGDAVASGGIAIPVMGVEAGDYTLVVRHHRSPSLLSGAPALVSTGWILRATSPHLCLCGAGYLMRWTPEHEKVLHPVVPPGWYEVEIHCGTSTSHGEEWIIEFVLRPSPMPPAFTADLQTDFNFVAAG